MTISRTSNSTSNAVSEQRRLETASTASTTAAKPDANAQAATVAKAAEPEIAAKTAAASETVDASRTRARGAEDAIRARVLGGISNEGEGGPIVVAGLQKPKPKPPPRPNGSQSTAENNIGKGDNETQFA